MKKVTLLLLLFSAFRFGYAQTASGVYGLPGSKDDTLAWNYSRQSNGTILVTTRPGASSRKTEIQGTLLFSPNLQVREFSMKDQSGNVIMHCNVRDERITCARGDLRGEVTYQQPVVIGSLSNNLFWELASALHQCKREPNAVCKISHVDFDDESPIQAFGVIEEQEFRYIGEQVVRLKMGRFSAHLFTSRDANCWTTDSGLMLAFGPAKKGSPDENVRFELLSVSNPATFGLRKLGESGNRKRSAKTASGDTTQSP